MTNLAFEKVRDMLTDYIAKDQSIRIDYDHHPVIVEFDQAVAALQSQAVPSAGEVEKVRVALEYISEDDRMRFLRYGDSAPKNGRELQAKAKEALATLDAWGK